MQSINLDTTFNSIQEIVDLFKQVHGECKPSQLNMNYSNSFYFKDGSIRLSDHTLPDHYVNDCTEEYRIIDNTELKVSELFRMLHTGIISRNELDDELNKLTPCFTVRKVK